MVTATVFVLGPSDWKKPRPGPRPMSIRRKIRGIFEDHGGRAILMENVRDRADEPLANKFLRILDSSDITQILVLWPLHATMPTTIAELVALRFRRAEQKTPDVWVLLERGVADLSEGTLNVHVEEGRVAYLKDLARSGTTLLPWNDLHDLYEKVTLLARTRFRP